MNQRLSRLHPSGRCLLTLTLLLGLVVMSLILTPSTIVDAVEPTTGSPEAELPIETAESDSLDGASVDPPPPTPTETPTEEIEETTTPDPGSDEGATEPTVVPEPTDLPDESQPEDNPTEPAQNDVDEPTTEVPTTPSPEQADTDLTPEPDPTPDAPSKSPQPTANKLKDVTIEAISAASAAIPGGTVNQRFQIANPNQTEVTIHLDVSTSAPGWQATVLEATGTSPINDQITIPASAHLDVIVRVTIPPEAYAGDRSTTSLTAIPVESAANNAT